MKIPSLGIILTTEFFYCEADQYFHLQYNQPKREISFAEYEYLTNEYSKTDQQFMTFYDYHMTLRKDKWEALPQSIDMNFLELFYEIGLMTEEEYMHYRLLYTEKNNLM